MNQTKKIVVIYDSWTSGPSFESSIIVPQLHSFAKKNKVEMLLLPLRCANQYEARKVIMQHVEAYKDDMFVYMVGEMHPKSDRFYMGEALKEEDFKKYDFNFLFCSDDVSRLSVPLASLPLKTRVITTSKKIQSLIKKYVDTKIVIPPYNPTITYRDMDVIKDMTQDSMYDVCIYGRKTEKREEILDALAAAGLKTKALGKGWDDPDNEHYSPMNLEWIRNFFTSSKLFYTDSSELKTIHLEAISCNCLPVTPLKEFSDEYFDGKMPVVNVANQEEWFKELCSSREERDARRKDLKEILDKDYTMDRFFKEVFSNALSG